MKVFRLNKLVRDKIVELIETREGGKVDFIELNEAEFISAVKAKILEEAQEIQIADQNDLIGELADLQELIDTLLTTLKISKTEVRRQQYNKNHKAGSFKRRRFVHSVELQDDSEWINYYRKKNFEEVNLPDDYNSNIVKYK